MPETAQDARTPEEIANDREWQETEELLGEAAGQGYSVVIHRKKPQWCAGYLDTWPLDEPITLADIKEAFGGRRFQLRIHGPKGKLVRNAMISIDAPPRRDGMLVQPDPAPIYNDAPRPRPVESAPQDPDGRQSGFLFSMLEKANDRTLSLFERMIENRAADANAGSPLQQIAALAEAVAKMREVSALFGVEQDSTSTMVNGFLSLLEKKAEQRQQQPPQRRPAALPAAPQPPRRPNPIPVSYGEPAPPPTETAQPGGGERQPSPGTPPPEPRELAPDEQPDDIDDEEIEADPVLLLREMDPKNAGEHLAAYFNGLSNEEARRALSAFLGQPVPLDMILELRGQSKNAQAAPSGSADPSAQDPASIRP